jgi:hypothetical protein
VIPAGAYSSNQAFPPPACNKSCAKTKQSPATTIVAPTKKTVSLADTARAGHRQHAHFPKSSIAYSNNNLPLPAEFRWWVTHPLQPTTPWLVMAGHQAARTEKQPKPTGGSASCSAHRIAAGLRGGRDHAAELGELNVQHYPNLQQTLVQSNTRSDINSKVAAILAGRRSSLRERRNFDRPKSAKRDHYSAEIREVFAQCAAPPRQTPTFHSARQRNHSRASSPPVRRVAESAPPRRGDRRTPRCCPK